MVKTYDDKTISKMLGYWKETKGYCFRLQKQISQNPLDSYLRIILAKTQKGEYVTWLFNASIGEHGELSSGHYFKDYDSAYNDYLERN